MANFLERSFPPGYSRRGELKAIILALAGSVLISLFSFLGDYSSAKQALYIRSGSELVLDETRVMKDFATVLDDNLRLLLALAALILVVCSVIHYAYYRSGSKSIYLMRRLPSRMELHRRCLLMPLLSALAFVLIAALLLLIYYAIYMIFTPEACLAAGQWQKLWGIL